VKNSILIGSNTLDLSSPKVENVEPFLVTLVGIAPITINYFIINIMIQLKEKKKYYIRVGSHHESVAIVSSNNQVCNVPRSVDG
jgi:type IV secretory pathway component VirB8